MIDFFRRRKYLLLLFYIPVYLLWFYLLERRVTAHYWVSYMPLDDRIPFLPGFVLAYCAWYLFLLIPGLYMLARDVTAYKRYLWFLILGFSLCLLICTVLPNGQNLRPQNLAPDTFCKRLILAIYRADTNTNVLPSMHVVGSVAVVYGAWHCTTLRRPVWLCGIYLAALLICASTVFIKQHSLLDILAGLAVSIAIWQFLHAMERRKTRKHPGSPAP